MQVTREIVNLLLAIAYILEVTSSSNDVKKRWYHALTQSLSIKLWLKPHRRWCGFNHFSKIMASLLPLQCLYIMIIKPLSSSLAIPLFMSVQSTLRFNYHYIHDKVMSRVIFAPHVASSHQLVDVFTKNLVGISYDIKCIMLGILDLYSPA